ncbi:DUF4192 family protein [Phytomonospora endophytica]|uniref:DUF4192 family protein n=1 Tax=Phytomonospora endophytica TaxID=714109 RepID=A0A841FSG9_9ACTN|nr:DUF4192 family protein [Phytomonospora endophytica]MBB6037753.1 hypothetical protein [Phytomonospora endophytica]GIG67719.1 hypothetical protein Pen01_40140 [Phytomonospora endophytica]
MSQPPVPAPPSLVLSTPADTLAAIPYFIGYHPNSDLVIVGLQNSRYHAALRCDLWPTNTPCPITPRLLADIRIDTALVASFGSRRQAALCLAATCQAIIDAGILAEQLIVVCDGGYRDFLNGGHTLLPLPDATSALAAGLTAAGYGAFPDRASFLRHLDPVPGAFTTAVNTASATQRNRTPGELTSTLAEFLDANGTHGLPDAEATAALLLAITAPDISPLVLDASTPERLTSLIPLWTHLVRHAPRRLRAVPAAFLAYTARKAGNTGLARLAIDHACAADAAHPVVAMIASAVDGWIPSIAPRKGPRT